MIQDKKQRMVFVDILKIIAIFLVVLGHTPLCNNTLKQWIYSFHMPLFFAIYGLTYDMDTHFDKGFFNKKFFIDKLKRLIVPYIVWGLIYSPLKAKNIIYILYGSQVGFNRADSLSSLWFLPCMFVSVCIIEILMKGIHKLNFKNQSKIICEISILVILCIISYVLPKIAVGYPWSINIVPMACSFIIIGCIVMDIINKFNILKNKNLLPWILICVICNVVLLMTFKMNLNYIKINNVDMASGTYGNYLFYTIDAVCGILAFVSLSIIFSKLKINNKIIYMSNNTLAVFVIHKPIVISVCSILSSYGINYNIIAFLVAIVAMGFAYIVSYFINLFCPQIIGNKDNK